MNNFDELEYIPLGDDKNDFNFFYDSMKIYFHNIDPENPNLTDHGELHINNVMRNANRLLEKEPFDLHKKDRLYLMQAICIHDLAIGNFKGSGREDHHNKIFATFPEILDKIAPVNARIKDYYADIICRIAASHSGNAKETYDYIADNYSITSTENPHVLFLAMLLRVADELDITQERLIGYPLDAILPKMDAESQLHWIKHESIVNFKLSPGDKADYLALFLKPDMPSWLDKNRDDLNIKFTINKYLEFMSEAIIKLKNELKSVCEYCKKIDDKSNWKLSNIILNVSGNNHDNSGYIEELNKLIFSSNNVVEEEIKAYDRIDNKIKMNNENKNNQDNYSTINLNSYDLIGANKYRNKLDNFIKRNSMLKQGCYEHSGLRIFSWFDSYGFHQYNFFINITSDIIVKDINERFSKTQDIDFIIGLGLKGAKIASVVGLKLDKPVFFYINKDIIADISNINESTRIILISDCIITGKSAKSCIEKFQVKKENVYGVYCVFLRNNVKENNNDNVLIKEKIPIFTINDTYKYIVCPIEKQENCPVYISNGNKCNKQAYK
jgi:orotate phosphoribosyltransferase